MKEGSQMVAILEEWDVVCDDLKLQLILRMPLLRFGQWYGHCVGLSEQVPDLGSEKADHEPEYNREQGGNKGPLHAFCFFVDGINGRRTRIVQ